MSETIDICERAADALNGSGEFAQTVQTGLLTALTKSGCVVRLMPASNVKHYMDGSRREDCNFQFIAKGEPGDDEAVVAGLCEAALRALRWADLASANGSYTLVSRPEPVGDVDELAVGNDGRHVYAVAFKCVIVRKD